ncbi:MAG: hypothetical protein JSV91_07755 [Phycisphaerales bacterium]|nr:MAG: hypothetical protein JSV91_07755 [Phycisphaerales bacterium]
MTTAGAVRFGARERRGGLAAAGVLLFVILCSPIILMWQNGSGAAGPAGPVLKPRFSGRLGIVSPGSAGQSSPSAARAPRRSGGAGEGGGRPHKAGFSVPRIDGLIGKAFAPNTPAAVPELAVRTDQPDTPIFRSDKPDASRVSGEPVFNGTALMRWPQTKLVTPAAITGGSEFNVQHYFESRTPETGGRSDVGGILLILPGEATAARGCQPGGSALFGTGRRLLGPVRFPGYPGSVPPSGDRWPGADQVGSPVKAGRIGGNASPSRVHPTVVK